MHTSTSTQPLADVAADPALLQDIVVGGAIASAVGFSLYNGLKARGEAPRLQRYIPHINRGSRRSAPAARVRAASPALPARALGR